MEMPIAKDGSRYVITFTDDYSRGSWAYAMRWKHGQSILPFAVWRRGVKLNSLGLEVCSDRQVFSPIVGEEPLDLGAELSVPERTNRTIRERINTLLSDANLPPSWWTELVDTVVYRCSFGINTQAREPMRRRCDS
jgi:hypothetical protein